MREYKPIRTRRGKVVHLTDVEDYRRSLCGRSVDGGSIAVDEACNCKACLRAQLDALN